MSATSGIWVLLALVMMLMSLQRPAWAVGLYMQTFFAAPQLWWWGKEVPSMRYALVAGFVLAGAVVLKMAQSGSSEDRAGMVRGAALGIGVNATLVHLFLAGNPRISLDDYTETMKFVLLFFLIDKSIKDRSDFRLVTMAIALGSAYIGWEVTVNGRGDFSGSRLEGVGAPAADTSNGLACVMLVVLPVVGSLFIGGTRIERLTVLLAAPLTLNVLLLCNSRGAFLGLVGSGLAFLLLARGPTRKKALWTLALGAVALYLLLGDPKILDRFETTFVGGEDRDNSASSRLVFWAAGFRMLQDYPLGAGGGAFKFVYATRYLREVGSDENARSLHNGYLTDATDWGIQGLSLKLLFIFAATFAALRTVKRARLDARHDDAIVGLCLVVATVGYLIASVFGSYLNNEWGYWIVALTTGYARVYALPVVSTSAASTQVTADVPPPKIEDRRAAYRPAHP